MTIVLQKVAWVDGQRYSSGARVTPRTEWDACRLLETGHAQLAPSIDEDEDNQQGEDHE